MSRAHSQWQDRLDGKRPIIQGDSGREPLRSIVQHESPVFRQLITKEDATYYLKNWLCRSPTPDEVEQYRHMGTVGTDTQKPLNPDTLDKLYEQSLEFTNLDGLERVHNSESVVFIDSLCELATPSKSYMQYVDAIKKPEKVPVFNSDTGNYDYVSPVERMTKAEIIGFSGSVCSESGNTVYIPKYDAGEYSPYSKAVSVRSSSNRLASQICKLPEASKQDDLYLMGWDMTFPKEVSLIALTDPEKAVSIAEKSIKVFMKQLLKDTNWIRREGQKLGYFFNIHVWHSHHVGDIKEISTPDEPHLHVHLNLVNMVVRERGRDVDYVRFNPNVKKDLVKKCWSYAIFKGASYMVSDPVFYLHYIPLTSRARISHRIRYCGRSPLNDLFDYYQDHDFNEGIPEDYNKFLIDYKNRRRPCGFLRGIKNLVGDVDGERVCPVCSTHAEKIEPLSVPEMLRLIEKENIPVAIYKSNSRQIAIIRRGLIGGG